MNKDRWGLNKSQRMQLKAFICLLGIVLIIVLLLGRLLLIWIHRDREPEEEMTPSQTEQPHIPVVQEFSNVWVLEDGGEGIVIFRDGQRESYPYGQELSFDSNASLREQVADMVVTDGAVTAIHPKTEKICGRILSADETGVEVEGYGRIPLSADYRGYRLYGSLEMCTVRDIPFGYSLTDLCLENGEICAVLIAREEAMEYIRVLIKTADYGGSFHEQLVMTADTGFSVIYGDYDSQQTESHAADEEVLIDTSSNYFQGGRVWVVPDVQTGKVHLKNVGRSQGTPSYRGQMELVLTEQGIVLINQVPLEEYLYSVVPSEMPSSYPMEALKAQAICARTYAYNRMEHAGYPQYGAHVDDSTSYQVYNNILEQESTTTAVKNTYGQLLYTADGDLAQTYYYSTSCGVGSDETVWKTENPSDLPYLQAKHLSRLVMTEQVSALAGGVALPADDIGTRLQEEEAFAEFIISVDPDDFEAEEGWYRWTYSVKTLNSDYMTQVLQARYAANSKLVLTLSGGQYVSREIDDIGTVKDIRVEKRGPGGVAEELVIEAENGTYKVISEHNIRYVLNDGSSKVTKQDGSQVSSPSLLPSGFFVITTGKEQGNVVAYTLTGGGFGHGVGMSQNGARQMAKNGFQTEDILMFFFEGCEIKNIYE